MSREQDMLVSCLCVTEGRPAFMPWLLWCFDRQVWPHRELIIVDSSEKPFQVAGREHVRLMALPQGTRVSAKRNLALQEARGEIVTWFDDDDWQHPNKLSWLVKALSDGASVAGSTCGWFVDLMASRCAAYRSPKGQIIFNSAGFRRDEVGSVGFREDLRQASDTQWMRAVAVRYRARAAILQRDDLFFWLSHEANLSNPSRKRRFPEHLDVLRRRVGADAWGETDEALDSLRRRIEVAQAHAPANYERQGRISISAPPVGDESALKENAMQVNQQPTPVGLIIKATVLDAPFLDIMVRHMITQARYPFAEKAIVVERPQTFTGKYRARPRTSQDELERVLKGLLTDGMVDCVREVDSSPAVREEIMGRYFPVDAHRVPTHAVTGGPIYATLFGLESMTTDYVLQMDADILFYTGASSWVGQALRCMAEDPKLWLMMTHPGPPAGAPGKSLGAENMRRASWDEKLSIWRFRHATTRYFLCDRRRLHHSLPFVASARGAAPLEQCLSLALRQNRAFRGNLGNLESWHLHVWHHGEPFPAWAHSLTKAVEAGDFPILQRGDYDLRLDRTQMRGQWEHLLRRYGAPASVWLTEPVRLRQSETDSQRGFEVSPSSSSTHKGNGQPTDTNSATAFAQAENIAAPDSLAPVTVVIPVRDRSGDRLRNALRSLNWQSMGRPEQVFVVSHGSRTDINEQLARLCDDESATLIEVGNSTQPWNKPLALNTGIRRSRPDVPLLMTMDADMILAPDFLSVVVERLLRQPPALVLCRISDLPSETYLPDESHKLRESFELLLATTQLRPRYGSGGIQAAARSFFFTIRGYDEDLAWWGAMDGDVLNRAHLMGLEIVWLEDKTAMMHQWHPRKHNVLTCPAQIEEAKKAWRYNHELVKSRRQSLKRNPNAWGGE